MNRMQQQGFEVLFIKGVNLHQQGQLEQAKLIYEHVLSRHPRHFEAIFLSGLIAGQSKRPEIAIEFFRKAIEINPNYAEAHNNHGNALQELERFSEALDCYARAIQIKPDFALAHFNQGNALKKLNRLNEALECYDKAVVLHPDYFEALIHRGNLLIELKHFEEALKNYDRAISINPDIAEAHSNRGNALQELNKFNEAIASYDKAIYLKSEYATAYANRGNSLLQLKRLDEAVISYQQAINIQPETEYVLGTLLNVQMQMCDWECFEEALIKVTTAVKDNKKASPPFQILSLTDSLDVQRKVAQIWIKDKFPADPLAGGVFKLTRKEKIRLGYFSGDFREHAVSYLAAELFEVHDKNRFELIAFNYGPVDKSSISSRIENAFHEFKNVKHLTDAEIAFISREMKIDVAIDLSGLTQYGRAGIFSCRAAPVQISYLGYLGTMGCERYDYLMADETLIPEGSQQHYSEKIIYLPSYQINDSKRTIADRIFTKKELALPEKGFVFCCFNNNYKIMPFIFDVWMCILKNVPDSVLFLFADNKWVIKNLQSEAEKRGVSKARLIFAGHIGRDEYLSRYKVVDLFLDTLPYNAGTTASDALWTGLPVLTCFGQSFASRMAASILIALDLPELVTSSLEQYQRIAVDLALNPLKLSALREKLNQRKNKSILFDSVKMTRKIEEAYIIAHEHAVSGFPADHIYVSS